MREISAAEQRYQAVLAVIAQGETVKSVCGALGLRANPENVTLMNNLISP
jgi:hypothetical protein